MEAGEFGACTESHCPDSTVRAHPLIQLCDPVVCPDHRDA